MARVFMPKSRFRFSLKWLLGFAAMVAVAAVPLVNASPGVWIGVRTTSWALLLLVVFGATVCTGWQRQFCLGFAVVAWGNLFFFNVISWDAFQQSQALSANGSTDGVQVLSTKAWEFLRVERTVQDPAWGPTIVSVPDQYLFRDTGVHLLSILLGFVAGSIAAASHPLKNESGESAPVASQ
jgi:hypothetical protein